MPGDAEVLASALEAFEGVGRVALEDERETVVHVGLVPVVAEVVAYEQLGEAISARGDGVPPCM